MSGHMLGRIEEDLRYDIVEKEELKETGRRSETPP